jgi:hypothetical protein
MFEFIPAIRRRREAERLAQLEAERNMMTWRAPASEYAQEHGHIRLVLEKAARQAHSQPIAVSSVEFESTGASEWSTVDFKRRQVPQYLRFRNPIKVRRGHPSGRKMGYEFSLDTLKENREIAEGWITILSDKTERKSLLSAKMHERQWLRDTALFI